MDNTQELLEEIKRLKAEVARLTKERDEGWKHFYQYRALYAEMKYPGMKNKITTASNEVTYEKSRDDKQAD